MKVYFSTIVRKGHDRHGPLWEEQATRAEEQASRVAAAESRRKLQRCTVTTRCWIERIIGWEMVFF